MRDTRTSSAKLSTAAAGCRAAPPETAGCCRISLAAVPHDDPASET